MFDIINVITFSEAGMNYSKKTTKKKQKKLVSKHTKNKNKISYLIYKTFIFLFLFTVMLIAEIGIMIRAIKKGPEV